MEYSGMYSPSQRGGTPSADAGTQYHYSQDISPPTYVLSLNPSIKYSLRAFTLRSYVLLCATGYPKLSSSPSKCVLILMPCFRCTV